MRQKGDAYSDAMPRQVSHQVSYNVALDTALSHYADEQLPLWQAICATQLDYIVIYNREGYIAQISEHVCALLGLDDTQDPLQLPREHAVQFFLRDEQGRILPDEHWPVSRILRGEVIKQAEAVDAYIRRTDGHEVLVGVYGAPLYDPGPGGQISGAAVIVREADARRKMEHRTLGTVEALLAIEEALCAFHASYNKGPAARGDEAEYAVEQRLVALPRYLLNCQCAAMALLEPDTLALHPIALTGASLEQERRWRHNSYGVHLRNYLGDSHLTPLIRGLLHDEVLVFDRPLPFLSELSNWGVIAPIQRDGTLSGILLLGYSAKKPALKSQLSSSELAIVRAIAGLAACIAEREQQRQAREQLQKAREDAEQEAQQVKRLLRNYLATLKREFRPVLASIQNQSALLHDHQFEVAEMQACMVRICTDARRLEFRINEILEREEATPVALPLDSCWFDLNALLVDVINHFRPTAPRHSMHLQLARALPLLWGDQDKLTQAIASLIGSAIKSSPAGGEINITSASEGAIVRVIIQDQGSGANVQELESWLAQHNNEVWLKRTRIETEGLPLACSVIQMHGGQIWTESTPRKGATIYITLPFSADTL